MVVVDRSALTGHSAAQLYSLVEDIKSYPQFLPWCERTVISARTPERTVATIYANYHGLRQDFTTENTNRPVERIEIRLVSGPFRTLEGHWSFTQLGEHGSRVDFRLQYQFSSRVLDAAAGPVFHHIANGFVDAFVRRAEQKFGVS